MPLYLDDCLIARQVARQLRAAGHLIYVTSELGVEGKDDEAHLENATRLGAVIATQNRKDFDPLHHTWQASGREHAGILVTQWLHIGPRLDRLSRAARMLTPELAANQLMVLGQFRTEAAGADFIRALSPQ